MGKLLMYRVDWPFDYVVKIVFCVSRVTLFSLDHRFESITLWLAVRGLIIQENGERERKSTPLFGTSTTRQIGKRRRVYIRYGRYRKGGEGGRQP